jgi:hypothetical protein
MIAAVTSATANNAKTAIMNHAEAFMDHPYPGQPQPRTQLGDPPASSLRYVTIVPSLGAARATCWCP